MGNDDTSSLNLSVFNLVIDLPETLLLIAGASAYINMACVDVVTSMADNRTHTQAILTTLDSIRMKSRVGGRGCHSTVGCASGFAVGCAFVRSLLVR